MSKKLTMAVIPSLSLFDNLESNEKRTVQAIQAIQVMTNSDNVEYHKGNSCNCSNHIPDNIHKPHLLITNTNLSLTVVASMISDLNYQGIYIYMVRP